MNGTQTTAFPVHFDWMMFAVLIGGLLAMVAVQVIWRLARQRD
jgi:hypothetical protein